MDGEGDRRLGGVVGLFWDRLGRGDILRSRRRGRDRLGGCRTFVIRLYRWDQSGGRRAMGRRGLRLRLALETSGQFGTFTGPVMTFKSALGRF